MLFRQVDNLAILVFTGRKNAGYYIRNVHIIADTQQVLALPDLHIGVIADPLDQIHIVPVTS